MDHPEQVDLEHLADHRVVLGGRVAGADDAGAVDPDIRPDLLGERPARLGVAHVEHPVGPGDIGADHAYPRAASPDTSACPKPPAAPVTTAVRVMGAR